MPFSCTWTAACGRAASDAAPDEARAVEPPAAVAGPAVPMVDHAIVVGYGRVGRIVVEGLETMELPTVVIEQDRQRTHELRAMGVPAVHGNATTLGVLEHAHVAGAKVLVLAAPETFQTSHIIELARGHNPDIEIAVRGRLDAERRAQLERCADIIRDILLGRNA